MVVIQGLEFLGLGSWGLTCCKDVERRSPAVRRATVEAVETHRSEGGETLPKSDDGGISVGGDGSSGKRPKRISVKCLRRATEPAGAGGRWQGGGGWGGMAREATRGGAEQKLHRDS